MGSQVYRRQDIILGIITVGLMIRFQFCEVIFSFIDIWFVKKCRPEFQRSNCANLRSYKL